MAITQTIDVFTQTVNAAFVNAYMQIPPQPPISKALTVIGSKGRIENYPWLYPPPLMHQWHGYRQYAKLGQTKYTVPNLTYTAEFEALLEDLDDDQIDGFKMQAAALARGAQEWMFIQSLVNLAAGQTTLCFDGTNFFANSHTIGSGDNLITAPTASTDGVTHAMAVLVHSNRFVKPLMWQNREAAKFRTDAGSEVSEKTRLVKWWSDLRGAAAFGFWWDAVLCLFANTPTVIETQTAFGLVNAAFRTFTYPKNLASDKNLYPHGQTVFNTENVLTICSSKIEHIVRQALTLSLIATTENYFRGFSDLSCSGYLDGVV